MNRVPLPTCIPLLSGLSVCKKIGLGYVPATVFMVAVAALSLLALGTDTVDGELASVLRIVLVGGITVASIAAIAAMLTAFSVGERVRGLLVAMEAAAHGDLNNQVQFRTGGDEVDRLAASFNAMAADLRQLVEDEQRARREAEAVSEAKSQFLVAMSHELRTPLTIVLGFSDILAESAGKRLTSEEEAYIRKMHEAAEHLISVANDALDISRVEAGQTIIDRQEIDLQAFLDPIVESFVPLAAGRSLTFTAELPDEPVTIKVDWLRTRQVLYNLVSNAIKFTLPGGSVVLRARVTRHDLLLEVEDTGIGIPLEQHGRVFSEFERFHAKVLRSPGAGLGLALSKRLVELHGGEISFVSAPGVGSTFRVSLPNAVTSYGPFDVDAALEGEAVTRAAPRRSLASAG